MHRIFITKENVKNNLITITSKEKVHYLKNVLRLKVLDYIFCFDGKGREYKAKVLNIGKNIILLEVIDVSSSLSELKVRVTIAQSLIKLNRFEFVLQKGTEIGAVGFLPFFSAYSVVKPTENLEKKFLRWKKIVEEASKQSKRVVMPTISFPCDISKLILAFNSYEKVLVAYEKSTSSLRELLNESKNLKNILLVIGPEGSFSPSEIDIFSKNKASFFKLGPNILRAETASLVALTCVLCLTCQLGG